MNLKNVLKDYIIDNAGSRDTIEVFGNYGFSYNYGFEYVAIYKIVKTDKELEGYVIEEYCYQSKEQWQELLGKKFLDNSLSTQQRKVRNLINEYIY